MANDDGISILVIPDGAEDQKTYRLSGGQLRFIKWLGVASIAGLVLVVGSWAFLVMRAAEARVLEVRVDSLLAEQERVELLAGQLADLEGRYEHIRSLFGSSDRPSSDLWLPPGRARLASATGSAEGSEIPTSWPLTQAGFITRTLFEGDLGDHSGLDIAVPTDSYVRAAGAGQVVESGDDELFGRYVLIDHGDGYESLYGHTSMTVVSAGERVQQNEVIALSGSSGRSTAPHLHFEIRLDGRPVDPLTMVDQP